MGNRYGTVSNLHYLFLADCVSEAYDFKCLWINILPDKAQDGNELVCLLHTTEITLAGRISG